MNAWKYDESPAIKSRARMRHVYHDLTRRLLRAYIRLVVHVNERWKFGVEDPFKKRNVRSHTFFFFLFIYLKNAQTHNNDIMDQGKINKLKACRLFCATPMYGGQCFGLYMKACLDLQMLCITYGIEVRFSFLFNESLITRGRNYLVDQFLSSGFTHLLFLDADISYNPQDVLDLIIRDFDLSGGPYAKKSISWKNVALAARNHPDLNCDELASVIGDFVFNVASGTTKITVNEPLEVMEIGTGFFMAKRVVFEKMIAAYPNMKFKPDFIGQKFEPDKYIYSFFDCSIDTVDSPTGGGTDRYLSEDYFMCQLWRKIGGKVYLMPWMRTQHIGTYAFTGNMQSIANLTGQL